MQLGGMGEGAETGITVAEIPGGPLAFEPPVEPCAFIIFGAAGDLTRRKLVPALYNLTCDRRLPEPCAILGVSREAIPTEALRARLRESVEQFSRRKPVDEAAWQRLAAGLVYVAGDLEDAGTFARLREQLENADRGLGTRGNRVFYLAVPPAMFAVVLENLHRAGLLYEHRPTSAKPWCRVVIEKPFGRDLESARALNRLVGAHLDERQTFRIDHYLGKETVQNILVLRFGNAIFEPLWNRQHIDHVQITAAESIGVEGRGRWYDSTGVLRDMVQSHLLQVLSLCALEAPVSFTADDIRDEKARILRAMHPFSGAEAARRAVCAQYRGYLAEEGVSAGSRTPTYVAMKLLIDNWRWQGVPFYLRTGKKLARRLTETAIQFHSIPLCLFRPDRQGCQNIEPNVLTMRIQPDEGVSLRFVAKVPADHLVVGNVLMTMSYASAFGRPIGEAYERLLLDVIRGDATLFARRDIVEESWKVITPILEAWDEQAHASVPLYDPGSAGPPQADELIARDGRAWRPLG